MAIYVIRSVNEPLVIKIGRSVDPCVRLQKLQTGNPKKLIIIYTHISGLQAWSADRRWSIDSATEAYLHHCLRGARIRGEWFDIENMTYENELITTEEHALAVIDSLINHYENTMISEYGDSGDTALLEPINKEYGIRVRRYKAFKALSESGIFMGFEEYMKLSFSGFSLDSPVDHPE